MIDSSHHSPRNSSPRSPRGSSRRSPRDASRANAHGRARLALALVCAFVCAHAPARAQTVSTSAANANAPASGRGSITVRVIDDANQPVQNAVVLAFAQGRAGRSSRMNYDNSASRSGRYVLGGLDPGLYSVSVNVPGYVPETAPVPPEEGAPAPTGPAALYRPGDSVTMRMIKGGVITGRVTDADGNPIVGARVSANRLRDAAGRPLLGPGFVRERRTDDRGIYRLYGLSPGAYVVFAGGRPQFNPTRPTPYDGDAPTYYPSSTREGASEVQVQAGQEMTDVDIRYRGEKGHAVSGAIDGLPAAGGSPGSGFAVIALNDSLTGAPAGQTFLQSDTPTHAFSIDGVADGDYELTATTAAVDGDGLAAAPVHVSVRGADVSGVRLTLGSLGSLAGRVAFEPLKGTDAARAECQNARPFSAQEMLIWARREGPPAERRGNFAGASAAPDTGGAFTLNNLRDGRLRLSAMLGDDGYYLRAITMPAASNAAPATANGASATNTTSATSATNVPAATNARAAAPALVDLARNPFVLRPGDKLTGALVTVAAGAASLRGRVAVAEGEAVPDGLRVYLVPAERERAEDVLRYAEADVQPDGSFTFKRLAPGGYLLVARPAPEGEQPQQRTPLAFDAAARAALRRDAEAAKNAVTLQPCQRAEDFALRLARP